MVTYYAAMGRYRLDRLEGDVRFPVLMLGGQEYHVSVAEFMVWSSLLWNILNRDALQAESARAAAVFDCSMDEELFERTLSRLLFRGLVVSGEGETGAEALQDLEDTTPGVIYLDTAEYLLVTEAALDCVDTLRSSLSSSVRVSLWDGEGSVKTAAKYLGIRKDLPKLRDWSAPGQKS